ncbi:MAG: hypothetical protein Rhirs2KO_12530 [Rhizobiaceae bacterium]
MIAVLNFISAAFALFLAGAILSDRAGWDSMSKAIARGLAVLSLAYLSMLAVVPAASGQ